MISILMVVLLGSASGTLLKTQPTTAGSGAGFVQTKHKAKAEYKVQHKAQMTSDPAVNYLAGYSFSAGTDKSTLTFDQFLETKVEDALKGAVGGFHGFTLDKNAPGTGPCTLGVDGNPMMGAHKAFCLMIKHYCGPYDEVEGIKCRNWMFCIFHHMWTKQEVSSQGAVRKYWNPPSCNDMCDDHLYDGDLPRWRQGGNCIVNCQNLVDAMSSCIFTPMSDPGRFIRSVTKDTWEAVMKDSCHETRCPRSLQTDYQRCLADCTTNSTEDYDNTRRFCPECEQMADMWYGKSGEQREYTVQEEEGAVTSIQVPPCMQCLKYSPDNTSSFGQFNAGCSAIFSAYETTLDNVNKYGIHEYNGQQLQSWGKTDYKDKNHFWDSDFKVPKNTLKCGKDNDLGWKITVPLDSDFGQFFVKHPAFDKHRLDDGAGQLTVTFQPVVNGAGMQTPGAPGACGGHGNPDDKDAGVPRTAFYCSMDDSTTYPLVEWLYADNAWQEGWKDSEADDACTDNSDEVMGYKCCERVACISSICPERGDHTRGDPPIFANGEWGCCACPPPTPEPTPAPTPAPAAEE